MSVSPYTVAHDPEVQQYNRLRAATLAGIKARKHEAEIERMRIQKGIQKGACEEAVSEEKKMVGRGLGVWRRVLGRSRGRKEREGLAMGGKAMKLQEEEEEEEGEQTEEWSDAETEVEMVDVLHDGKGIVRREKYAQGAERVEVNTRTRTVRAPPYVFLQAMAGVTLLPVGRSVR